MRFFRHTVVGLLAAVIVPAGLGEPAVSQTRAGELKFDPVTTKGLRIEVQLRRGLSGEIHEWRVEPSQNIDG